MTANVPQTANILVVIDTEYVKKTYPNGSKDPNHPTGINHSSQFMIATGTRGIVSGQGTADLSFKLNVGDYASFAGTSIYGNSDDAVILYGIKHWSGEDVFNTFVPNVITRNRAVQPDPSQVASGGIPPLHVKQNFNSLDSKVKVSGTENFYVYIAIYTLEDDGQTQSLFGYYYWDPTITVKG
jgi:nematocidal protein AidA